MFKTTPFFTISQNNNNKNSDVTHIYILCSNYVFGNIEVRF